MSCFKHGQDIFGEEPYEIEDAQEDHVVWSHAYKGAVQSTGVKVISRIKTWYNRYGMGRRWHSADSSRSWKEKVIGRKMA